MRVRGLGFRDSGFRDLGVGVWGLGFRDSSTPRHPEVWSVFESAD